MPRSAATAVRSRPSRTRRGPAIRLAVWLAAVPVTAAAVVVHTGAPAWAASGGIDDVRTFATRLTHDVTAVAASVAVLFLALSGVRWTMSSGNPMRQTEARNALVAAATGLAIVLSANVIVTVVVSALR